MPSTLAPPLSPSLSSQAEASRGQVEVPTPPLLNKRSSSSSSTKVLIRRASDAARSIPARIRGRNVMNSSPNSDKAASTLTADGTQHSMPAFLLTGVSMLKVSSKKKSSRVLKLLPEHGQLAWVSQSKKSGWAYLCLENVLELRFANEARSYRIGFNMAEVDESKWMTVIYVHNPSGSGERRVKMLHWVAFEVDVANAWKESLTSLVRERRSLMEMGYDLAEGSKRWNVWLKQCWRMADSSEDERVDYSEVVGLCQRLGIAVSPSDLQAHFKAADANNLGYLDFTQFQAFVKRLRSRIEIDALISSLTSNQSTYLSRDLFLRFMRDTQESRLSSGDIEAFYTKFAISKPEDGLSSDELANFLISSDSAAFDPRHNETFQDMSRPLCEYFVSSSHNTYLVGNQLNSDSTPEGYIRALQQGCRSVELDVWDGPDGQPVVYHGRTLTSKILFADALHAIKKYAFVASPYPVILSVEVHCDTAQQSIMATQLRSILGPALVDKHLDTDHEPPAILPSPEELKYRFLLKAKNLFEATQKEGVQPRTVKVNEESESDTTTTTTNTESENDLKKGFKSALRKFRDSPSATSSSSTTPSATKSSPSKDVIKAPMSFELAALIVYTIGVKCRGFNKKETYAPFHVLSLGEKKAGKAIKEARSDLLDHNRTHLVRSYPAGTRFTSSNYLPQHLWVVGMQMVAINWQTFDIGAEINAAFFNANGRAGYILKPDILRMKDPVSKDKEVLARPKQYVLKVSILSAQQLTRSKCKTDTKLGSEVLEGTINPWVEVAVFAPGVEYSRAPRKKTYTVIANGFNPVFAPESSTFQIPFEVIGGMLELVFFRFSVQEGDGDADEQLGKFCISAALLQPGYRHLPLYDALGQQYLFSSLFVETSIQVL